MTRRLAELDDTEARLEQEIEQQQQRLASERRTVAALSARLRQQFREEAVGSAAREEAFSTV